MVNVRLDQTGNRREFLRGSIRYAVLAVVSGLSVFVARSRRLSGQTCVNRGICSGCAVFAGCGLPQALSAKQVMQNRRSL